MKHCVITVRPETTKETFEYICTKARARFGANIGFSRVDDPSIIGGFILQMDAGVYDMSYSALLRDARRHLCG